MANNETSEGSAAFEDVQHWHEQIQDHTFSLADLIDELEEIYESDEETTTLTTQQKAAIAHTKTEIIASLDELEGQIAHLRKALDNL